MLKLGDGGQIFQLRKFWNFFKTLLFERIKSIQQGFSGWKQMGVFMRLSRLNNVMKSAKCLSKVVKLKSPRRAIYSYLDNY